MATRKPSGAYHHQSGELERVEPTGSVAPQPVTTAPRPGPSPEQLAELALRAKREELAGVERELERKRAELERRPDTLPPKSGDQDRQLGLAVRTIAKQGATIIATAVVTAVIAVVARPAASPEKVEKVVDDQQTAKKQTDEQVKACMDRLEAQQLINEANQDWIATLADKQGITPGRNDPNARVRTPEPIDLQSIKLEKRNEPPRFQASRPLPPVPPRP